MVAISLAPLNSRGKLQTASFPIQFCVLNIGQRALGEKKSVSQWKVTYHCFLALPLLFQISSILVTMSLQI